MFVCVVLMDTILTSPQSLRSVLHSLLHFQEPPVLPFRELACFVGEIPASLLSKITPRLLSEVAACLLSKVTARLLGEIATRLLSEVTTSLFGKIPACLFSKITTGLLSKVAPCLLSKIAACLLGKVAAYGVRGWFLWICYNSTSPSFEQRPHAPGAGLAYLFSGH